MHENIKKLDRSAITFPDPSLVTTSRVIWPPLAQRRIDIDVLRLDLLHPVISGNKWFKLKGHLQAASDKQATRLITFGGAWSNHIIAAAYAARQAGLPVTGIIRGEKPATLSATLQAATAYGMQLEFISRHDYGTKETASFQLQLTDRYPEAYIIPEGGGGEPGINGSAEILDLAHLSLYTHVLCAVGTGTTFLGLCRAAAPGQQVIGIPVLKGIHTPPQQPALSEDPQPPHYYCPQYHFGGYARHTPELLTFMNRFYQATQIPSDFVYTGKLFFAAIDMAEKDLFSAGSRLLLIHSGGLQGNQSLPPGTLDF